MMHLSQTRRKARANGRKQLFSLDCLHEREIIYIVKKKSVSYLVFKACGTDLVLICSVRFYDC